MNRILFLVGGMLLLLIRGVFLWVLIPMMLIVWVLGFPHWKRVHVTVGHLVGWADLNLAATLQRTVLRPCFSSPIPWVPVSQMPHVKHRVGFSDPA